VRKSRQTQQIFDDCFAYAFPKFSPAPSRARHKRVLCQISARAVKGSPDRLLREAALRSFCGYGRRLQRTDTGVRVTLLRKFS
jgi:hypothetical protein